MSDGSPLEKAHAASGYASSLAQSPTATPQNLQLALKGYKDAADRFEQSGQDQGVDDATRRTLQLLTTQNRKLARDVERRIAVAGRARQTSGSGGGTVAGASAAQGRVEVPRRNSSPSPGQARETGGLGLGAIARQAWPPPGVATRLSPSRGVPPFATRPAVPDSPFHAPGPASSSRQTLDPIMSPLHSSSSSSGTEVGESYINFGAIPNTTDPFSRFWGMLDNMLDDISNPVAFASAPVEASPQSAQDVLDTAKRKDRPRVSDRRRIKGKGKGDADVESFYLVNKGGPSASPDAEAPRNHSPTGKTPEELALENENLRASLDALAVHSHQMEVENKRLRAEAEERTKTMKSVIGEVRREAQKAKHGQDLMRSQLLVSIPSPNPRGGVRPDPTETPQVAGQRKRIQELEEEVSVLKLECEKQRESANKYKERLERIKANAKSKKEAKAKADNTDQSDLHS